MARLIAALLLAAPLAAFAHEHEGGAEHAGTNKECKKHFGKDKAELKACRACVKQKHHHFHAADAGAERCHPDHKGVEAKAGEMKHQEKKSE